MAGERSRQRLAGLPLASPDTAQGTALMSSRAAEDLDKGSASSQSCINLALSPLGHSWGSWALPPEHSSLGGAGSHWDTIKPLGMENCTSLSIPATLLSITILLLHYSSQGMKPLSTPHQCCQHFWPQTFSPKLRKGRLEPGDQVGITNIFTVSWDSGPPSLGSASCVPCRHFRRLHHLCTFWKSKNLRPQWLDLHWDRQTESVWFELSTQVQTLAQALQAQHPGVGPWAKSCLL